MNNPDIILHLGLPKTGTTWMQSEIFGKLKNINYIHKFELGSIIPDNNKKTIISMESLSGIPFPSYPAETRYVLADRLKVCFPEAKIVIGFRDKEKWKKSVYKQYVIGGRTLSKVRFLEKLDDGFLDFDKYINYLNILFKDVYVYQFEDLVKDKHVFVKNLCTFMNVEEPNWKDLIYRKGLSDGKTETLRKLNCIIPTNQFSWNRFVSYVSGAWRGME